MKKNEEEKKLRNRERERAWREVYFSRFSFCLGRGEKRPREGTATVRRRRRESDDVILLLSSLPLSLSLSFLFFLLSGLWCLLTLPSLERRRKREANKQEERKKKRMKEVDRAPPSTTSLYRDKSLHAIAVVVVVRVKRRRRGRDLLFDLPIYLFVFRLSFYLFVFVSFFTLIREWRSEDLSGLFVVVYNRISLKTFFAGMLKYLRCSISIQMSRVYIHPVDKPPYGWRRRRRTKKAPDRQVYIHSE